ncbi:TorF family putative porin, partial [Cupriavidus gilardii]
MTLSHHAAAALLAVPAFALILPMPAAAQTTAAQTAEHTLTANVSLASEYRYRGIMQTNRRPAIQGGFDY